MKKTVAVLLLGLLVSLSIISVKEIEYTSAMNKINSQPVIIIDAGHGGEDGGAVGADNTAEKDINLEIALDLNEILSTLGYNTKMVRTEDISIHNPDADTVRERKISDIHNRAAIMESYENCIYVSIHQNKYESPAIWGAQTFYSPNDSKSPVLAQLIQSSIKADLQPENDRQIKKSGTSIYVLYNAKRPAVMVECGFISNPEELKKLKSEDYRQRMAMAIAKGIINYFISEENNGAKV